MHVLVLLSAGILICCFGVAFIAKAQGFAVFQGSLSSFGFPTSAITIVAVSTLCTEAVVLAALLAAPLQWAGWLCLLVLVAFSVVAAIALLRGRRPQCQCFGNVTAGSVGLATLGRNAFLAAIAIVLLTENRTLISVIRASDSQEMVMTAMAMAIASLVALVIFLLRRYGEALHTLDALGVDSVTQLPKSGPEPGEQMPELPLATANDRLVTLDAEILKHGSEAIVLLSTMCGHCEELVPVLQAAAVRGVRGIVVVKREKGSNFERLAELHQTDWPVLFTASTELNARFNVAGFPALVPLDERGNARGGIHLGRQGIEAFLNEAAGAQSVSVERYAHHDRQNSPKARTVHDTVSSA